MQGIDDNIQNFENLENCENLGNLSIGGTPEFGRIGGILNTFPGNFLGQFQKCGEFGRIFATSTKFTVSKGESATRSAKASKAKSFEN